MESVLAALTDTLIPTILVIAGIGFLLLSIVGQLAGRTVVPPERQRWAAIMGGILLVSGMALYVVPPAQLMPSRPPEVPPPRPPTPDSKGDQPPPPSTPGFIPQPSSVGEIHIPSLNARLIALRFFEGHPCRMPPLEQRVYRQRFAKAITLEIYTEITLEHPKYERRLNVTIQAVYQRNAPQDGEIISRPELRTYIPADEQRSIHSLDSNRGGGFPTSCLSYPRGGWPVGAYTVAVSINGEKVTNGSFEIHE
jgi:hypothetical protein